MKRRILAFLLASLMLLCLFAGCNKNNSADPGSNEPGNSNNGKENQNGGSNPTPDEQFRTTYAYVPTYYDITGSADTPAFDWIQSVTVAGEKLYVMAQVVTGKQTYTEEYEGEVQTYDYDVYATRLFSLDMDGRTAP